MTAPAATSIAARMLGVASRAPAAPDERGRARKAIPYALTNVSSASPAVRATTATEIGIIGATSRSSGRAPWISDWSSVHSATKPTLSGSAAAPRAPRANATWVTGIRAARPPIRSRSRSPVACSTAPAPRNSAVLKAA